MATPIGNRADITLRALHVLQRADTVACEDTRVTAALLSHYGLPHKPLLAVHAHNENEAAARVCEKLAAGEAVAFVSDAGTPGVSDPGARLVAAAVAAGHPVVPIPGASSALAAISVAGDASEGGFVFHGFLPAKGAERGHALQALAADSRTQVLFEAPHRIQSPAGRFGRGRVPERRLTLGRELTKQFESVVTMPAGQAPAWLEADANHQRGEFVLVLHAAPAAWPSTTRCRPTPSAAWRCCSATCRSSRRWRWRPKSAARRATRCTSARCSGATASRPEAAYCGALAARWRSCF